MSGTIKKAISSFLIFGFLLNTVLPINEASAMTAPWWSGSQATDSTGVVPSPPGEGSPNDNRKNQERVVDPVSVHNGDFIYQHQDLLIPSRAMPLEIIRTYKSQSRYNNRFGYGWDISYNKKIVPLCNGDLYYLNGELNRYRFIYVDGTNYISPKGIYDTIVQNLDGTYTLKETHGTAYEFDQNGVLTEIRDRNGNSLHFSYDPDGKLPIIGKSVFSNDPNSKVIAYDYKLIKITDSAGRVITLNYNSNGRLENIVDFSGRAYTYTYDPSDNGDLISFITPATERYPSGLTTTYSYTEHNLETITDARGQAYLINHYDANDRVYQQDSTGGTFVFSYDSANSRTTITDPKGFVTEWSYDSDGSPISKKEYTAGLRPTDPAFYTTTYQHNNNMERTKIVYPRENVTQYDYDSNGNLLEIWRNPQNLNLASGKPATANSSYQTLTPDKAVDGNLGTMWNSGGFNPSWLKVDLESILTIKSIKVIHGVEHNQTYSIDISDDDSTYVEIVASGSRDKDFVHTFSPNATGRFIRINYTNGENDWIHCSELEIYSGADAGDTVTTFTYEPDFNQIKTLTDPKGNTTTYYYDYEEATLGDLNGDGITDQSNGNLVKITYPQVGTQTPESKFTYNSYGQVLTVTDPNGNTTKYEYYPNTGYLAKVINAFGTLNLATEMTYDTLGNVLSIKDPKANTTTFQYDSHNNLLKTTSSTPFNYETKYEYDANDNLSQIDRQTNDVGNPWQTTTYTYDPLDRLATIQDELGNATTFSYDANGNRSQVRDAELNTTTYIYDERNLLWKVTDALGSVTEYTYDENRNLKEIKDAKGNKTTYAYDDFDRLNETTYADGSKETYAYDANSNLTTKADPKNQIIYYDYDGLNRLTEKGLSPQGTVPESVVTYFYDVGSRLSSVTDTNGAISYTYDALNRITQVTTQGLSPQGTVPVSYEYDANSNRTKLVYPDSTYITYEYDQLNRLTAVKDQAGATVASYQYDALSRRTQLGYANNTQATYQYDAINRLTSLTNTYNPTPNTYSYTYDNVGNRKTMTTQAGTHNYTYDNIHQLKAVDYPTGFSFPDMAFNYDDVGNRSSTVNGGTTSYTPNSLNQYTQAGSTNYVYDNNGNLTSDGTKTYTYDYENRLIEGTVPDRGLSLSYKYDPFGRRIEKTVNSATTRFLYDGDQIIAEYDGSGTLIAKYVYGSGIDEVVKGLSPQGTVPEWYYHYDGLGSVTNLTDSSGTTVETYSYDAFGKSNITSSIGNRFMFTGREYDQETGLYHYRARAYSPTLGRFLQRDPVGYSAGINLYSYCSNNPVNWIDPFGWDKQGNKGNFPGGFMIPPKITPDDPRPKDPTPREPVPEEPGLQENWIPPLVLGVAGAVVLTTAAAAGSAISAATTWTLTKVVPWLVPINMILSPMTGVRMPPGSGTAIEQFVQRSTPLIEKIITDSRMRGWPF